MTLWRVLIGIAAVLLALWVIAGEQLAGVSADATVNARLVTLRSPIAGTVSVVQRPLGAPVAAGELVASVENALVDDVRRDDLRMEVGFAQASVARLSLLRDETDALMTVLEERSDRFRTARIAEIETRLEFARERLDILEGGSLPESFDIRPPRDVGPETSGAGALPGLRALWINAVNEQIAVLENALETARNGVFLGDGYNDAPNAEQRLTELKSERASLSARLTEAETRLQLLSARLESEQLRVARARGSELASPVNGVYWEALASDREVVQRGDPVARLADCDSTIVTLSVTESVYNTLNVGDAAVFRPRGKSQNFRGTVTRLAGAGAGTVYRNLAVAPSQRHLERHDVTLLVPDLANDQELRCAIGRTGRVFFDRRPLDWLRGLRS